jgi:hypothetical protein
VVVQHLQRLIAVGAGRDLVARPLQGARQEGAQGIVVFGEQDALHGR